MGNPKEPNKPTKTTEEIVRELQEEVLTLKTNNQAMAEENARLMNRNQELFLRITGEKKDETDTKDKDVNKEYKEYVGEDFFNSLNNKEQNLLKTILEGDD